jgi:hypothetical protein
MAVDRRLGAKGGAHGMLAREDETREEKGRWRRAAPFNGMAEGGGSRQASAWRREKNGGGVADGRGRADWLLTRGPGSTVTGGAV